MSFFTMSVMESTSVAIAEGLFCVATGVSISASIIEDSFSFCSAAIEDTSSPLPMENRMIVSQRNESIMFGFFKSFSEMTGAPLNI